MCHAHWGEWGFWAFIHLFENKQKKNHGVLARIMKDFASYVVQPQMNSRLTRSIGMREQESTAHTATPYACHGERSRVTELHGAHCCVRPLAAFIPCKYAMFRPRDTIRTSHHRCHDKANVSMPTQPIFPLPSAADHQSASRAAQPSEPTSTPRPLPGCCSRASA